MMIFVLTIHRISNVLLCNVTDRVSFWFVVTDSSKNVTTVPGSEVEAAIRYNHCFCSLFFLADWGSFLSLGLVCVSTLPL